MTIYYTYCSYETDKGDEGLMYIGKRKCPKNKTPWTDNYFGSQRSKRSKGFKDNPNKYKVILGLFETAEEALAHEIELHRFYDVAKDPRFANQAKQTSTKFSMEGRTGEKNPMYGRKHTEEAKEKMRGRKNSEEALKRMSEIKMGENNPFFGKSHGTEARKKISKGNSGVNHHNYDHTLYDFENEGMGLVELQITKGGLGRKYGINSCKISGVIRGSRDQIKGWRLLT